MREKNIVRSYLWPSLFAGLAIFLVVYLLELKLNNIIFIASLGSSAVLLATHPSIHMAKLRVVLFAYFIAAVIGYVSSLLAYDPLAAGVGIGITLLLMFLFNAVHAPAAGIVMAFLFQKSSLLDIGYLLLGVFSLLIVLKALVYLSRRELSLKDFHLEFRKEKK